MNLIFIGSPGSGKGTQSKLIIQKFGLTQLSTGDLLRAQKGKNPEVDQLMGEGKLIPDSIITELLSGYIKQNNLFENIILDGSPRSLNQYISIRKLFSENGHKFDAAIYLHISDEEAIKRLSARRQDRITGEIYNMITNPPGAHVDPTNLIQRPDDREEAILERLSVQKVPQDLLQALQEDGILIKVDGQRPIEEISAEIVEILENIKNTK